MYAINTTGLDSEVISVEGKKTHTDYIYDAFRKVVYESESREKQEYIRPKRPLLITSAGQVT